MNKEVAKRLLALDEAAEKLVKEWYKIHDIFPSLKLEHTVDEEARNFLWDVPPKTHEIRERGSHHNRRWEVHSFLSGSTFSFDSLKNAEDYVKEQRR